MLLPSTFSKCTDGAPWPSSMARVVRVLPSPFLRHDRVCLRFLFLLVLVAWKPSPIAVAQAMPASFLPPVMACRRHPSQLLTPPFFPPWSNPMRSFYIRPETPDTPLWDLLLKRPWTLLNSRVQSVAGESRGISLFILNRLIFVEITELPPHSFVYKIVVLAPIRSVQLALVS